MSYREKYNDFLEQKINAGGKTNDVFPILQEFNVLGDDDYIKTASYYDWFKKQWFTCGFCHKPFSGERLEVEPDLDDDEVCSRCRKVVEDSLESK